MPRVSGSRDQVRFEVPVQCTAPAARTAFEPPGASKQWSRAVRDVFDEDQAIQASYLDMTVRAGGRIVQEHGLDMYFGTHASWIIINGAYRRDPGLAPREAIGRTDRAFRDLGRTPLLMTFERTDADLEAALAEEGWHAAVELPMMVRSSPLPAGPAPVGAELDWLVGGDLVELGILRDVLVRGYGDGLLEVVNSVFGTVAAIRPPGVAAAVARLDGMPAAAALVYIEGAGAVVAWVATAPEARRRGLGRFVTAAATKRGFDLGAAWVTLQASEMGAPLYRSMGYHDVSMSRIWLAPPPKP